MLKSILPTKNFGCGIFMNIYSPFFMYKFNKKLDKKLEYPEEEIKFIKPDSPKLTRSYSWSF
jgi:hypothetical protein